jgi:hypothetical protein
MMTQAGGYSESGRPLTARNAVASHRLTRSRRAATAVASTASVPAASRTRGSASTPAGERVRLLAEDRGGAGMAGPIRSLAVVSGVMDARVFHTGLAGPKPTAMRDVDNGVIIGFDVRQTG